MALVGRVWQTLLEVDPDVCRMVTSPEDLQRLAAQFSGRTALRAARAGSAGDSLGTLAFASAALLARPQAPRLVAAPLSILYG